MRELDGVGAGEAGVGVLVGVGEGVGVGFSAGVNGGRQCVFCATVLSSFESIDAFGLNLDTVGMMVPDIRRK